MPPVLKPAQAGDPEVRRPSGPDRLAVAIQNLAVPLTHSSRPRKRRDEIATSIHVSMSLALRRKGRPSAWCANPSDEIVRGPSDRVPGGFRAIDRHPFQSVKRWFGPDSLLRGNRLPASARGLTVAVGADTIRVPWRSSPAGVLKSKVADGRGSEIGDSVGPGRESAELRLHPRHSAHSFVVTVKKIAGPTLVELQRQASNGSGFAS